MSGHKCAVPGCEGHLGKHANCLSRALWNLGTDYADEFGGNSVDWHSYCMLFLFDESVWLSSFAGGTGQGDDLAPYLGDFGLCDTPDFVIGARTYVLLTEGTSGIVFLQGFESEQEARDAFDDVMADYERWSEVYEY